MTKSKSKKKSEIKEEDTKTNNDEDDGELPELALVSAIEKTWIELSDRALNDNNWNDEDCEKLIDEACILSNKKLIKIHSMWLSKCNEYCKQQKSKTELIKFAVIIGYPHGQQCIQSKIAEIKYCLKQNIDKIIIYISCGKIINRDWKYIKKEIMTINKIIGNKCKLQIKYAKSDKIGVQTNNIFQQTVKKIIDK